MATTTYRKCKKVMTLRLNEKEDSIVKQYCLENGTTYTETVREGIKLLSKKTG